MSATSFPTHIRVPLSSNFTTTSLMNEIQSLEQAINKCDWPLVRQLSQSLTTSGRQLVLQHLQQSGHFNPLPHAENLFKALASSQLQWEDETKHQLARAARLFLELSCMKSSKEKREIYAQTAKSLRDQIDTLLQYTKEEQVGLHFELTCSSEALKLMERLDTKAYLSTLLGALGGLSAGSIPELLRLIPDLIGKMHKDWFLEALYISWTGILARDNLSFFQSHCSDISQHLETIEIAQAAVEFLGDIVWQGSLDTQYQALVHEKVSLINLASQKAPKRALFNLTTKMWPVRYRAVQILSTLIHHQNSQIAKKATEALLNCSLRESNPKVRRLLEELEKNPSIRQQWKEQFEFKKSTIFEQNLREQEDFERQDKALKEREQMVLKKASANALSSQALAQERKEIEQEKLFLEELRQECLAHKANAEAVYHKIFKEVNTVLDDVYASQPPSRSQKEDPSHFLCPILGTFMEDPVIADDEHSYERRAITKWVEEKGTSPITRAPISSKFMANRSLRDAIEEYKKTNPSFKNNHNENNSSYSGKAERSSSTPIPPAAPAFSSTSPSTAPTVDTYIDHLYSLLENTEVKQNKNLYDSLRNLAKELNKTPTLTDKHLETHRLIQKLLDSNQKVRQAVAENIVEILGEQLAPPPAMISPKKADAAALPSIAFGKAEWAKYFGDVGAEPSLPTDIQTILQSPCPFWPDEKVQDTHILVLIPQTVNGKPLTIQHLGELIQKPLQGASTKYRYFNLGEYKDNPTVKSHWVLLTRDVIEGSRNKSYSEQQALIQYEQHYEVPTILDATVAILMEYVRTGTRLYSNSPLTYTLCQEKWNRDYQLVVGGFSGSGLGVVRNSYDGDRADVGVGGLRKF